VVHELATLSVEEDLSKKRTQREPRKGHIQYSCLAVGPSKELESAMSIAFTSQFHRDVTTAGRRKIRVLTCISYSFRS